jgi:hypothetical protein
MSECKSTAKPEEIVAIDIPNSDPRVHSSADEPGFTDKAFDARYDGRPACFSRSAAEGRTSGPNPHAVAAAPRSRNSFMRARARRLAAYPPPWPHPRRPDRTRVRRQ